MKHYHRFRLNQGSQIVIGLVLGIIIGAMTYHNQLAISTMSTLGTIFLRLIQMIVLPIVVSCLTVGIANIGDLSRLGRIGAKTLVYFEILSTIAILVGLLVANVARPGDFINIHSLHATDISKYLATAKTAGKAGFAATILGVIPTNIFASLASGDMMPVIFFSVFLGLGIAAIGEQGKVVIKALNAVSQVMFRITNWVMHFAPFGVFGLIGMTIAQMGLAALLPLGYFILLAYLTMIFFCVVILGLIAKLWHLHYWQTMRAVWSEIILAFSTASSEATLPRLMGKMKAMGVENGVASFVIPTGYTFNLDGSAIYQSLAAIFLAQAYGLHLSLAHQFTLLLVLMITSKGMAGVPGASFVVLLASVATIGVPVAGLTFIAGIDRFVDMGRTAVNVVGNTIATLVIAKSEHALDQEQYQTYLKQS